MVLIGIGAWSSADRGLLWRDPSGCLSCTPDLLPAFRFDISADGAPQAGLVGVIVVAEESLG